MLIGELAPPVAPDAFTDAAASRLVARLRAVQGRMADAVLGGDGEALAYVAQLAAEAAEAPVLVAIPRLGQAVAPDHAADGAALGRWVADRVLGRRPLRPACVRGEVPVHFRGELVGILAVLGHHGPPRPAAIEVLRAAVMPMLIALAVDETRAATEHCLRGAFLQELRTRRDLGAAEIVRRAARLGCDVSRGALVLCAQPLGDRPHHVESIIAGAYPGALVERLEPAGPVEPVRVYALLVPGVDRATAHPELVAGVAGRLADRLAGQAIVGVSSFRADPAELGAAMLEAELMLDALARSGARTIGEVGDGVTKLLFRMVASHPEEVRAFYEPTIAAVARHDDQCHTGLLETLRAYLEANCNMNATASAIFAHRHTVAYRLQRIHELSGLDPTVSEDRERLGVALKLHRIVAPAPGV